MNDIYMYTWIYMCVFVYKDVFVPQFTTTSDILALCNVIL